MRHAQLKISRSKLLHNYNFFRSKLNPQTKLLVLVKANGYGAGDTEIAKLCEDFGADYFGVAHPIEGIKLKIGGIKKPIIVLTPGFGYFGEIIDHSLEPSLINKESALEMADELKKRGINSYPVHIKLDTGMQRVGFEKESLNSLIDILKKNPQLRVKSVFSHLAAADESKHDDFTRTQIQKFNEMSQEIISNISYPVMRHILNSSGIERFTEAQMDMVRLGIGIYGTSYVDQSKLKPAATFAAPVIQVKQVSEGTVGYGRHGIVGENGKTIATIPIGYADGVNRHLGRGAVSFMVNGKLAPTIGNICMDTLMIDVTGIDVKPGDEVTIFGDNPHPSVIATALKTITYEVFTSISSRVERVITD
ncbi:MAG TPA: alanine racemase [Rikenellaceae bacterium]|nr:alanine racemase [Rikenellaceae bacterium]